MKRGIFQTAFAFAFIGAQAALAQGACLNIARISVSGAKVVQAQHLQGLVSEFEGRCIGLADFDQILERITLAYVDRGYILARAYLPEQDLSDGQLDIAIVEGTLSQIRLNGAQKDGWAQQIFPNQIGKPVQLRAIEQGLDQIKSMPRWQAEMALGAGNSPGETILDIQAKTEKPGELTLSTHNRGSERSGQWVSGMSYNITNALGLNDTITLSGTRSVNPGPISLGYQGDTNSSFNATLEIPFGRANLSIAHTFSDYKLTVPGAISPIPTNGLTRDTTLRAKLLLHRNQTAKTHLAFDLVQSENLNWISGTLINASSRVLASLRATLSHERPLSGGDLSLSIWHEQGLSGFGAENGGQRPTNSPNAQFNRSGLTADYRRNFGLSWGNVNWASILAAQYSQDLLYGGQQFSVGGASSVRGSLTALGTGSSGLTWRNEIEFSAPHWLVAKDGKIKPYLAVDIGKVWPHAGQGLADVAAMGGVIGIRVKGARYDFDASWQEIRSVSGAAMPNAGVLVVSLNMVF